MSADRIDVALRGTLGGFVLDAAFVAPMRGVTALFGPSGCGKTSVLRGVAGLTRHGGHVRIGAETWQDAETFIEPHRRPIGYVFQEASLFPHMSVRDNLMFGRRRTKGAAPITFDETVALMGLERLVDRGTAFLSGGERQRVSIGRALLSQPRMLLMDEPLSALDRPARDEILPYLEGLHARLDLPILLVTHDLSEVERLADHLALMAGGRVTAQGPLNAVLNAAPSQLSRRRDFASVLAGQVLRREQDGLLAVDVHGQTLLLVSPAAEAGDAVRVRIAASDVSMALSPAQGSSILNSVPSTVTRLEPIGPSECIVHLLLGGRPDAAFAARISNRSAMALKLEAGRPVIAQIKGISLAANRSGAVSTSD